MAGESYDLIVRGGTLATADGAREADVGVRDGRIAALGALAGAASVETIDARGLHVLPGVIDTQVHFREPGLEHKEDIATGTAAAVLGGVTTVFEMPNTRPSTTTAEALADKLARARGRARSDIAFFVGATRENAAALARLERLPGCCGVKMFMGSSTGDLLVPDDEGIAAVLRSGSRRMAVHSEDEARLVERAPIAKAARSAHAHPEWRDVETAVRSTKRLLALAREARRPVHVLHVTTGEEMALLREHKGLATVEVTPQHLTLAAPGCYDRLGNYARMNPPIRGPEQREALWRAVTDGVVDVLGSDHAPHTRAEKDRPYFESPSGMPGVQTLLTIMLDHVNAGRLSLARLIELTSAGPARIYGILGKGRLEAGFDADLVLVDLKARRRITNDWIASRCGWTPFDGIETTGWPVATILRGRVVMRDGELRGPPSGAPLAFRDTMHQTVG